MDRRKLVLLAMLAGCDWHCPSTKGACVAIDIEDVHCKSLPSPFEEACDPDPLERRVGDVVNARGILVVSRDDVLTALVPDDDMMRRALEESIFERRTELVAGEEYDCKNEIGAAVQKIGLDVDASAIRHISVAIEGGECDPMSDACEQDSFVESMPLGPEADAYVAEMRDRIGDRTDLHFVDAAFIGNLHVQLEAHNRFSGDVDVNVGDGVKLGLHVAASNDWMIELTTGASTGLSLGHTTIPVTEL